MARFIHDVLKEVTQSTEDISQLTFVLPNKRAGVFLKNELSKLLGKTLFAPEILSIEDFVKELSQLTPVPNTELLFKFYKVYLEHNTEDIPDAFDTFSKWAQIVLQDYNEIDRHLADAEKIFDYLSAVKKIEQWSLDDHNTTLATNHLLLWQKLLTYYNALNQDLIKDGLGYQGLIYKEAVENLQSFIEMNATKRYVFLGFNALNKAESLIIQELLQCGMASIYWDTDQHFLQNSNHDAGHFMRHYKSTWPYFRNNSFDWENNYYQQKKNIRCISIPQNVGQAKHIGELLMQLSSEKKSLDNTALILGDETLLTPIISSLPSSIETLNITMGFPLKAVPLVSVFQLLFRLHGKNKSAFYYKDVIALLSHQNISGLFESTSKDIASEIIAKIQSNNLIYLTNDLLNELSEDNEDIIHLLFQSWDNDPSIALKRCTELVFYMKDRLNKLSNLVLEHLYKIHTVFNSLIDLNSSYNYINSIKTLQGLFNEILSAESIDFKGEPLQGLQVMGMLESRVLDFETVIISSVNEGILPSGKTMNSFIPYDIKLEHGLPTYKEKDAVYAYHFFRLLQRAKNVYLIYNSEPDVLAGGEKSRFITQLEIEGIHNIEKYSVSQDIPKVSKQLLQIKKTRAVQEKIKALAESGFSPSSLTQYIRNPIDFYNQKILGINDQDEVEETVAANTLGTVVHNTLEAFYKPLTGNYLTIEILEGLKPKVEDSVTYNFKDIYKKGDLKRGKNLIIFEIAKRYVLNFLNLEIEELKQGNSIKILAIESDDNHIRLNIPELDFPVFLKGKVDRVDEYNGTTRIIDYKTGHVDPSKLSIVEWEDLNTDYEKYSKPHQILAYAYMMNAKAPFTNPVEAGIICFKNLSKGFMKFGQKESTRSTKKTNSIDLDMLTAYEVQLKKLILEICNPNIDFIEKEV